jgi:hypothetical protein
MNKRNEPGNDSDDSMFDAQPTVELTGNMGVLSLSALDKEFERAERYRAAALAAVRLLHQAQPNALGALEVLREALVADGVTQVPPKR